MDCQQFVLTILFYLPIIVNSGLPTICFATWLNDPALAGSWADFRLMRRLYALFGPTCRFR